MTTKIATVDMVVKWRLSPRKRIKFGYGGMNIKGGGDERGKYVQVTCSLLPLNK